MKTRELREEDKEIIDSAYNDLIQSVSETMTPDEVGYIKKAYELISVKYADMVMDSGRPVVLHCIEVAQIAYSEMGLRSKTVVSALLHNITRYTDVTIEYVKEQFGDRVASILNDLEKVMGLDMTHISTQSDTFRKLFLSMIDDIRVVMLIIAHCMDSTRHLADVDGGVIGRSDNKDNKHLKRFFDQTKYVVIPIVHRLGLYKIKQIFEEALMKYENPVEYQLIKNKINLSLVAQEENMANFLQPIRRCLSEEGIDATIKWRTKSIPSIFAKMQAQNVPFEQVYDLFAVRVIINNTEFSIEEERSDCWKVYSIVSNLYQPNPSRLRDWVTKPKSSGYESLHTTVKYGGYWTEVQIRTKRMDDNAEKGTASHWLYKSGKDKHQTADEWLNQIREIMESADSRRGFNVFDGCEAQKVKSDKIFIITPQGDVKQIQVGATILDFAFEINSQLGCQCIGAKVNGKTQTIRYELHNGDRVEIQTNNKQTPKADWLNYVTTEKSKAKIKRFLKDMEMKEAEKGSSIFHKKLKIWKVTFNDRLFVELQKYYSCESGIEFYHKIATEQINMADMKSYIMSLLDSNENHVDSEDVEIKKDNETNVTDDVIIIDSEIKRLLIKKARCCNPVRDNSIIGFISISGCISVHRCDCPNAMALNKRYPYRAIKVRWTDDKKSDVKKK